MAGGRPRFRTVGYDLEAARVERAAFIDATRLGIVPAVPQLRFARVAGWWIERYERRVEAGERRERTIEHHRYHLNKHLLPALGQRLVRSVRVGDVAELITELRARGRSEKTIAGVLATLQSVLRFANPQRLDRREPGREAGDGRAPASGSPPSAGARS
ncbi:MAG TPA: site-specific integrase [Solirubrobacterales bacterium]|nr:site-specific integrase [Solirubrobacterales bacterium]